MEEKFKPFGNQAVVLGLWCPKALCPLQTLSPKSAAGADAAVKQDSVPEEVLPVNNLVIIAPKGDSTAVGYPVSLFHQPLVELGIFSCSVGTSECFPQSSPSCYAMRGQEKHSVLSCSCWIPLQVMEKSLANSF